MTFPELVEKMEKAGFKPYCMMDRYEEFINAVNKMNSVPHGILYENKWIAHFAEVNEKYSYLDGFVYAIYLSGIITKNERNSIIDSVSALRNGGKHEVA